MYYYTIEQYMEYKLINSGYNGKEIEVQLLLMKVAKVDCFRLFLLFLLACLFNLVEQTKYFLSTRDCV